MRIMLTGAAGFIGMHVAEALAGRGHVLCGLDDFNAYYDPALKHNRAARIGSFCPVCTLDIADVAAVKAAVLDFAPDVVVHLAAQAGVRFSLEQPMTYVRSNLIGHTAVLEACRALGDRLSHLVYASSSSVYGDAAKIPFRETDPLGEPASFYAATKRSAELMSAAYSHLYGIRQAGLRFFTVYGPWGRPDMAYWIWTRAILKGEPIQVFNQGDMRRDFTFVGDVAATVAAMAETPPTFAHGERPHRLYNLGNRRPVALDEVISILEVTLGRTAKTRKEAMQPGDVKETYADITRAQTEYGFAPATSIEEGLPRFVAWYRKYHSV